LVTTPGSVVSRVFHILIEVLFPGAVERAVRELIDDLPGVYPDRDLGDSHGDTRSRGTKVSE